MPFPTAFSKKRFGELYVASAVNLSEKERAGALSMFETLFKKKLIPHYEIDPAIQGRAGGPGRRLGL